MTTNTDTAIQLKPTEHLHVSWKEYGKLGIHLATKIKSSEWEFDHIVCIARGGMFIGDQLSRLFQKPLAVTSASSYHGENDMEQGNLKISCQITKTTDSLGKKILLVDDLADSGKTLLMVKSFVEEQCSEAEVRTAVIWKKTCSEIEPDYFSGVVEANVWIHQPFEVYDDITI